MVRYLSPGQPEPTDAQLAAWIADADERLASADIARTDRIRDEQNREIWRSHLFRRQLLPLLERWQWQPFDVTWWDEETRTYRTWQYLPYDSKSVWLITLSSGNLSNPLLEALIEQLGIVLKRQQCTELSTPKAPTPSGSRLKNNREWRHRMRTTDPDVRQRKSRAVALELHGFTVPRSRTTLALHERYWAELKRDNPELARR